MISLSVRLPEAVRECQQPEEPFDEDSTEKWPNTSDKYYLRQVSDAGDSVYGIILTSLRAHGPEPSSLAAIVSIRWVWR
jgi:hypothetical protein